jgi:hypothetical protein
MVDSASSHRFQDLDPVAGSQAVGIEVRARDHVPIDRHGNPAALQPEANDQALDGAASRNVAGLAVHEEL